MATNNKNNNHEKRIKFLEKVYLDDRERWQKNDERIIGMLKILKRHDEELKKQREENRRQGERLDSIIRIILRKLEE